MQTIQTLKKYFYFNLFLMSTTITYKNIHQLFKPCFKISGKLFILNTYAIETKYGTKVYLKQSIEALQKMNIGDSNFGYF